ncbi:MAG: Ig-like domain-containing protein [Acidobacteriaceae bacterium]|nr:Ig-like domain-containing protein [Acidobacteriaceae bacterium]
MKVVLLLAALASCLSAAQTTALYNPGSPTTGPFPANALTVADATQQTGIRINLPESFETCDVSTAPSVCSNTALLNQLDGFSVNPRVAACFSGPVNASTLSSGMQIVAVSNNAAVSLNQIIFDPTTNCAFAKPNQVLNQQSQYLFVVTDSVHDSSGKKLKASDAFTDCLQSSDPYCQTLAAALQQVPQHPASTARIVTASLFTTMSATSWLQNARAFADANQPPVVLPAGLNGAPSVYNLSSVQSMTWAPQGSGDDVDNSETITPSVLTGVGQVAFGMFLTPLFLDPTSGSILTTPTAQPISAPTAYIPVSFHLFLPSLGSGSGKYPVAIYGHGLGDNQFGAPTYIASTLAQMGIATLAIEITGHGYGQGGVVNITGTNGSVQTVSTPGRGILIPGNSSIGPSDGCILPGALAVRDCGRQTAVDLFALVQTIRETGGLGYGLDPSRIYYVGQSFGATYGTLFHATEANERIATMSGAGGSSVDVARLAITGRPLAIEYLSSISPALLNVDAGIAPPEAYFHDDFNDNYVYRNLPPVTNSIAGAMAIQAAFEAADWLGMVGDPLSFAPHLQTSPLSGVPQKATLFQYGYGDLEVPNSTESAVIAAANAQSNGWFFRFDKASQIDPRLLPVTMPGAAPLPILPHRILSNPTIFEYPYETPLSIANQAQASVFFLSGGLLALDPDLFVTGEYAGNNLFQVPSVLPTQLNFLQIAP